MPSARAYGDAKQNGSDAAQEEEEEEAERRQDGQRQQPAAAASQQQHQVAFRPFTRESLACLERRRASKLKARKQSTLLGSAAAAEQQRQQQRLRLRQQQQQQRLDSDDGPFAYEPDPYLASGQQLPPALLRQMPPELVGKPIEDLDPYYADREVGARLRFHC